MLTRADDEGKIKLKDANQGGDAGQASNSPQVEPDGYIFVNYWVFPCLKHKFLKEYIESSGTSNLHQTAL